MSIDEFFDDRSQRGEARGAKRVWEDASAASRSARRRGRVAVGASLVAAAAAATLILPGMLTGGPDDKARDPAAPPTTADPSPPEPTATGLALVLELNDRYRMCAENAGFDPRGVQVVVGDDGLPWAVKTGVDVPARIHGQCLTAIGGRDPHASSYGEPSAP
ncbi:MULTISPECIES: hypothetical protein [unclassified Nocardioides]|uniref:hypothetical protein n=1 Tax=unclassified Nocardioides TaxID=2615069 RepID=UPI0036092884